MEGEILFAALARRVRRFVLDGEPVMRYNNTLRGWNSIPLRLETEVEASSGVLGCLTLHSLLYIMHSIL
jgi:hypothetical protein